MIEQVHHAVSTAAVQPSPVDMRPYNKRQQLLQQLAKQGELLFKNRLEVRHLMTRDPIVIPSTMTVEEMDFLMKQRRLRHLLVCGRGGELLGVVSDRDLRQQHGATAQQLMSFPVMTATPETPLNPAITFLINENISCLPVVEHGRPCGILTTTDLVLTLQCMLQLWLRFAQVLQQDSTWAQELDRIAASLEGDLSPGDCAAQVARARDAMRHQIQDIINLVDLGADLLTGVNSRHDLEEMLRMLLAIRQRYQQSFSLVIVTIDHYARIRESLGDGGAGPLLKTTAKMIQQAVRQSDFVARCRDDAFAVVLTQTDGEGATALCRRLRKTAKENTTLDVPLRISISVVTPEPGEDAAKLLARAEAADTAE